MVEQIVVLQIIKKGTKVAVVKTKDAQPVDMELALLGLAMELLEMGYDPEALYQLVFVAVSNSAKRQGKWN